MYPRSVLSKNKKKYHNFSSENYHFYSRKKLQYITRACFRNETPTETVTETKTVEENSSFP